MKEFAEKYAKDKNIKSRFAADLMQTAAPSTAPLLVVNGIEVIYHHVILVLKGVSLVVPDGGIVALLGGNGAGKTATLRAVSNLLAGERGAVTKGTIELSGRRIEALMPSAPVQRGLVQVMEVAIASRI